MIRKSREGACAWQRRQRIDNEGERSDKECTLTFAPRALEARSASAYFHHELLLVPELGNAERFEVLWLELDQRITCAKRQCKLHVRNISKSFGLRVLTLTLRVNEGSCLRWPRAQRPRRTLRAQSTPTNLGHRLHSNPSSLRIKDLQRRALKDLGQKELKGRLDLIGL